MPKHLFEPAAEPIPREDAVPEEEGPEPARIPTSLTAALREQGHRYPHRVSRRMRRKMRGGQPGEERRAAAGATGRVLAADRKPDRARPRATKAQPAEERRPGTQPRRNRRKGRTARARRKKRTPRAAERPSANAPERDRPATPSISRPAQRRPGNHRSDRQGAAGPERRAHHFAHRAAGPLCGLHADGRSCGRFAQNSVR